MYGDQFAKFVCGYRGLILEIWLSTVNGTGYRVTDPTSDAKKKIITGSNTFMPNNLLSE